MSGESSEDGIRRGLASGDSAVLERLWDLVAADVLALAGAIVGSRHDAEDVLQDVFVRIARHRLHVARARNLRMYVLGMARHAALNLLRRRRRVEVRPPDDDAWLTAGAPDAGDGELADGIQQALASLPVEQRIVVTLKALRGMKLREIADQLDISLFTAASRLRYGLAKLRAALGERGKGT